MGGGLELPGRVGGAQSAPPVDIAVRPVFDCFFDATLETYIQWKSMRKESAQNSKMWIWRPSKVFNPQA